MKTAIDMAQFVGATRYTNRHYPDRPTYTFFVDQLERLVELVRADERARMAEQPAQQEPVAWMQDSIELYVQDRPSASYTIPLYTTPQAQRKPLTLQELEAAWNAQADHMNTWDELGLDEIVAWAQAAHNIKEKNT